MLWAAASIIYFVGVYVSAWLVGRFTQLSATADPPVILGPIFWPIVVIALPVVALGYGGKFVFQRGRTKRQIEHNRQHLR